VRDKSGMLVCAVCHSCLGANLLVKIHGCNPLCMLDWMKATYEWAEKTNSFDLEWGWNGVGLVN